MECHHEKMTLLRHYNHCSLNPSDLPYRNFHQLISRFENNHSPFLTSYDGLTQTGQLTFSEFYKRVLAFSQYLIQEIPERDAGHVAVAMENSLETLIAYSAVMNLGLTLIPLDPHQSEDFYKKIASDLKCDVVIAYPEHVAHKAFKISCSYLEATGEFTDKILISRPCSFILILPVRQVFLKASYTRFIQFLSML